MGLLPTGSQFGLSAYKMEDVQVEFRVLQASYSREKLDPDLKFDDLHTGLKSSEKEVATAIGNCARYVEIGLKILTLISEKSGDLNYKVNAHF